MGKLTEAQIVQRCGHCARCAKCGTWVKSGDPRWMDDFFLPERCPGCGEFKSRYGRSPYRSQWVVSYGYERDVPGQPPMSIWRPSTWLRLREWVEFDTDEVLTFPTQQWLDLHPNRTALKDQSDDR